MPTAILRPGLDAIKLSRTYLSALLAGRAKALRTLKRTPLGFDGLGGAPRACCLHMRYCWGELRSPDKLKHVLQSAVLKHLH
jgi:hypothetical protein